MYSDNACITFQKKEKKKPGKTLDSRNTLWFDGFCDTINK